jgi:hypothetical protein
VVWGTKPCHEHLNGRFSTAARTCNPCCTAPSFWPRLRPFMRQVEIRRDCQRVWPRTYTLGWTGCCFGDSITGKVAHPSRKHSMRGRTVSSLNSTMEGQWPGMIGGPSIWTPRDRFENVLTWGLYGTRARGWKSRGVGYNHRQQCTRSRSSQHLSRSATGE